ncbi:MAG: hypothetical protein IPL61_40810 [Myxococcales bacterium]|nr:hypothetical protein [Myxococcales bacterium]
MYRNEWDAAVARASALEQQLRQAQSGQQVDAATIATLTEQLQQANAELARLRGQAGPQPYGAPPYGAPGYGMPGYGMPGYGSFMYPSRASTILTLGILSLVVCGILGPIAWSMGNADLARIDRGELDPAARGSTQAGRICGMVASILMIIGFAFVMFFFVLAAGASTR